MGCCCEISSFMWASSCIALNHFISWIDMHVYELDGSCTDSLILFFLTILIFQFPNGLGLILGAMQLALYAYYSRKWRGQDSSAPLLLAWSKPEWMIDRSAGFAMVWILERVGLWWIVQFWLSLHMLVWKLYFKLHSSNMLESFAHQGGKSWIFFNLIPSFSLNTWCAKLFQLCTLSLTSCYQLWHVTYV